MDYRDPQLYPTNMMMVGPNSFPSTFTPSMMMTPNTAQFPLFNNNNLLPHSDPYNNNNNNDINNNILKPRVVAFESFKRKRGRPRKHSPTDGDTSLGLDSTHVLPSSSSVKKSRGRGRPPGSGKKQLGAHGGPIAANFTPHVFFVKPDEDVAAKIMAFCEQGGRTVIILSANGKVGNVTLQHPTGAQGVVTYKGHYTLISMSGSFQQPENNSGGTSISELSVSLVGLDGLVVGGKLAGKLTASSTVQVVVGSFIADGKKSNSNKLKFGPSSTPSSEMLTFGAFVTPTSLASMGPSAESSNDNDTFSEGLGLYNNPNQLIHTLPMYHDQLWATQT